eukprot:m.1319955 g.1319955  ORF g.1319955 m.1319955 type:complete len:385 (-) comp24845_c0_seq32:2773-3927(-)
MCHSCTPRDHGAAAVKFALCTCVTIPLVTSHFSFHGIKEQELEYGDMSDIVGGAVWEWGNSNAPHREQAGWLPYSAVYDLNAEGLPEPHYSTYCVDGVIVGTSTDYRGNVSTTISGRTCQQWGAQSPHSHSITPSNYPLGGLGDGSHNFCRAPDGYYLLWCYTTDPFMRYDICADGCNPDAPTPPPTAPPTYAEPCAHTYNITLAALAHLPDGEHGHSVVRFKRSAGGYYYISLRTALGELERSLDSHLRDRVYVHYQMERWSNTELVVYLKPGESWREHHTGWTLTFNAIDCPNRNYANITVDFCGGQDPPEEQDAHCAQAEGYHQSMSHFVIGLSMPTSQFDRWVHMGIRVLFFLFAYSNFLCLWQRFYKAASVAELSRSCE